MASLPPSVVFLSFPHADAGFSDEEWDSMSRVDRVITRDYFLNGCDREQTLLFGEYQTVFQVRKVERQYDLEHRPKPELSIACFHFPWE